jgi:3-hydroxyisobutyrate dehydrogenase-like beta-hydroxyacid dehydrogenase
MFETPVTAVDVGFVGLGTMGLPMARNTLQSGFTVHGYDLRQESVTALEEAGGEGARSVEDLARACDVVSVVVENDDQVIDVVAGDGGVFEGLEGRDGGIVLVHSTVHPETPQTLAEVAPEGVAVLDAPVSGTQLRAEDATLTFIVGGDETAAEYCRPLFEAMGEEVLHLGEIGSGSVAKIANNLVGISNIMTTAEGLRLGTAWGVDEGDLLRVMRESSAGGFIVDHWEYLSTEWGDTPVDGFDGVAHICQKDLLLALDLAESVTESVPGAAVASQEAPRIIREFGDE